MQPMAFIGAKFIFQLLIDDRSPTGQGMLMASFTGKSNGRKISGNHGINIVKPPCLCQEEDFSSDFAF
jgi:hypothetical protein